ncbi:transcription-repair coupling factor [uncultured Faecalibaculum sp.]|uniref:transcription-repair coupling factor n=1 Tax=uncultured Faecalibaculum sp. TaxID=1729681 RepID=UPI0025F74622|nr:transcription-repair coupling factor [uncultured Faecalibaculum sp.]
MTQEIRDWLKENPAVKEIMEGGNRLGSLFPMEEALVLASAFSADQKTRIIVKKDRYAAQQLYARLSPLVQDTLLFTSDESLRVQEIASSPEEKEEQLDVLRQLVTENKPRLIITNTAGFLRFLPSRDLFASLIFELKPGMTMDMATLKKNLNRAGYAKVNYVDRPLTYASRGGIVDIFTLEYDHPVRIEFFDTEIDSIRFFDENTQRTIRTVDSVQIVPATDLLFTEEQTAQIEAGARQKLESAIQGLDPEAAQVLTDQVEQDLRGVQSYDTSPSLYRMFALTSPGCLLDYVQGDVILSSEEQVYEAEKKIRTDNISFVQELVTDHKSLPVYTLFHDLISLQKDRKFQVIHEFDDLHHPIYSEIRPVDPVQEPLDIFLKNMRLQTYFAVSDAEAKLLKDRAEGKKIRRVEGWYYEGFRSPEFDVYTSRELFAKPVRHQRYQKTFKEGQMLSNVLELEPGDYVVHSQYGIGQYMGTVQRNQKGRTQDYLHVVYRGGDELFVPLSQFQLVRKYISKEGSGVRLSQLGSGQWQKTRERVSQKVEEIAGRLVELYAERNEEIGFAFPEDDALQREFDEAFPYVPTPDQLQATEEIKAEMEKAKPMDHLLCGDVGFGKTEVAMRCAFKAIESGKQVAFLCPTTVLALQHYKTLEKRFAYTGASVEMVSRFTPARKMKEIREGLKNGTVDIVVGTHKLLSKTIRYKDLGFLIIDEEQRFGVEHKEKIKEMKNTIDVLSLSATPIPRTLQMSLIGVRTISQLNTPPAHRHPIQTYVMEKRSTVVQEVIARELARDGQVFYLYNHVSNINAVAAHIQAQFPDAPVAVAHGRMNRDDIEQIMLDFAQGKYKILVCTTIIETGLDIENANTMIIEDADHFGLSQLYQIRGRVGRRDRIAYCYLMVQPHKQLTEQAAKRLRSIREFTQLGSGYKIAMRDLTIRGAGDMLGPQQAGFIDQVGLDLYLEMLSEAIARKQGKPVEKKEPEKTSSIQVGGYIPAGFTDNDGDKLALYQEIRDAKTPVQLAACESRVKDLFGRIPKDVLELFEQRRLDLFVMQPGVAGLKETPAAYVVTMDAEWSRTVDGRKLFDEVSALSRQVKLRMKSGQIEILVDRKSRRAVELLLKLSELLLREDLKKAAV